MLKQTESKNIFVVMYIAILSQIEKPCEYFVMCVNERINGCSQSAYNNTK